MDAAERSSRLISNPGFQNDRLFLSTIRVLAAYDTFAGLRTTSSVRSCGRHRQHQGAAFPRIDRIQTPIHDLRGSKGFSSDSDPKRMVDSVQGASSGSHRSAVGHVFRGASPSRTRMTGMTGEKA
jgi:hypothetical protein